MYLESPLNRPCSSQSICALACDIFFSKSNNNILNKWCWVSSKFIEEKHLDRLRGEMMSHEYDDTRKFKLWRFHLTWLSMTALYNPQFLFSMISTESTIFIFHVGGPSRDVSLEVKKPGLGLVGPGLGKYGLESSSPSIKCSWEKLGSIYSK